MKAKPMSDDLRYRVDFVEGGKFRNTKVPGFYRVVDNVREHVMCRTEEYKDAEQIAVALNTSSK